MAGIVVDDIPHRFRQSVAALSWRRKLRLDGRHVRLTTSARTTTTAAAQTDSGHDSSASKVERASAGVLPSNGGMSICQVLLVGG